MEPKSTHFKPGDIVRHKVQGYRALIVDIDPLFQASGRYNPQAVKREFALRNPWCRVLIDNSEQETYVEECHLEMDEDQAPVLNPRVEEYFIIEEGQYYKRGLLH